MGNYWESKLLMEALYFFFFNWSNWQSEFEFLKGL